MSSCWSPGRRRPGRPPRPLAAELGLPLIGKDLIKEALFDALGTTLDEVTVRRNPDCPVCGDHPTITEYVDYVEFCNAPVPH